MEHKSRLYGLQDIHLSVSGYSIDVNHVGYIPPIPGRTSEMHSHFDWAIHYIVHGYGTLHANGKKYAITPRMFYITPPGVIHRWEADREEPMEEYGLRISLRAQKNGEISELHHLIAAFEQCDLLICPLRFVVDRYIDPMLEEYESRSAGYIEMLKSHAMMLIIDTMRNVGAVTESSISNRSHAMSDNHVSLIDRHFRSFSEPQCTITSLSDTLHISKRHLSRIMNQTMGTTYTKYKNHLKIEAAKQLLVEDACPVMEIAEAVGFSSASYFSRCFRSIVGMSPQEYRDLHRK